MDAYDFTVEGHGSVYLLTSRTQAAREWVSEHIPSDALTFAGRVAVEPRFIAPIVDGIIGDGLSVRVE